MKAPLILPMAAVWTGLLAQEVAELTTTSENEGVAVAAIIDDLSRCSAVYEFVAMSFKTQEPSKAENALGWSRAVRAAAMHLLRQEHGLKGGEPRPLGDFSGYVDGVADATMQSLLTAVGADRVRAVENAVAECVALQPRHSDYVQQARDAVVDR